MNSGSENSYPLPADPALVDVARAVSDSGQSAWVVDAGWRVRYAVCEL